MPYVLDEEDDKDKAALGAPAAPGGIASGGMSPAQAPGVAGAQSAPGATSSPYVEFGRYLSANKAGADATAQKLGDSLEAGGKEVKQGLGAAQTAFDAGVDAGTPEYMRKAKPGQARGLVAAGAERGTGTVAAPAQPQAPGTIQAAPGPKVAPIQAPDTAPTPALGLQGAPQGGGPSLTPEEVAARAHATYTGPGSLSEGSDWAGLLDKGDQASRKVNLTGQRGAGGNLQGDAGIQTLLQEQHAGPGYTQGQSRFDAALTGAVGRGRFGELQRDYGDLGGSLRKADAASKDTAAMARSDVGTSGLAYGRALDDYKLAEAAKPTDGGPQAPGDTSGPAQGRGDWGQMDLTRGTMKNQAASDAGKFAANGGDEATYRNMTQSQWTQFMSLYDAARSSGDWASVEAYVKQLSNQGGHAASWQQAIEAAGKQVRGGG